MLYLEEDKFHIDPDKQILKSEEYAEYLEAGQVIEVAKKRAEQILEEAKEAYEEERKRGFAQGMEEGNEKISSLMIDTIDKTVKNFEEFENDVIEVVVQALKKILGELDKQDLIRRVVSSALETVRSQKKVTLLVSPNQVQLMRDELNDILAQFPTISFIDVASDRRIEDGGCILETEMGVVDATIEVQLRAIKNSLTKAIK